MQSARSSTDQVQYAAANPDIMLSINELAAKVQEQDQLLHGFQVQLSSVYQSVADLQHQSLYMEYLQRRHALTRYHQQLALDYAQNYGILPLYRGPAEICSQQQHPVQPASVVANRQAHYHIAAAGAISNEDAPISSIPDPPPPTPAPQHEFYYPPHILNSREVEHGKFEKATVYYQENNNNQTAVVPTVAAVEPTLNELLNIPPEWLE